jgi:1,4-dihydroxy-2-naphthoate octaprenyltransferase
MKKILKFLDYIFVLRPTSFFSVWTIFLAGFFVQNKFGVAATPTMSTSALANGGQSDFLWVGLFLTLLIGAIFILNQIKDRSHEAGGDKPALIGQEHLTPKLAFFEAVILIVAAVAFGFFFSVNMGIVFLVILIFLGILYNFKPFAWKDKPILGLVANILFVFLLFNGGWIINGTPHPDMVLYAIPYLCAAAAVYLYSTLPTSKEDGQAEKVTFGVKYGFKMTVYVGCILISVSLISAYRLSDELIFYPAFFSLPFFVWTAVKLRMEDVYRAISFPIMLLTLTTCIKYKIEINSLVYFFIIVGLYFLCKAYYRFRFGMDYPRLSV